MPFYRESFIFWIGTDDPACMWTGEGDLLLPADSVLLVPTIALGGGRIINIPDLEQLINGKAQRIEVTISGVSEEAIAFAETESAQIPGAQVFIGRIVFDDAWQPFGPVEWEWEGEGRNLSVSGEPTDTGRTRSLVLRIAAGETTRSRAPASFFTDADQRRLYPDDGFFSHVGQINSGTARRWGPK